MRQSGDNSASLLSSSPPDESSPLPQIRDVHSSQLPGLRIAPLREPHPRRIWDAASPLKPEITPHPTTANPSVAAVTPGGIHLPERLPTLEEFVNAARTSDTNLAETNYIDPNAPPPPRTILPAFINLQAVEKLPYLFEDSNNSSSSSSGNSNINGLTKRRRIDGPGDHFASEHLQLPVPQTQSEKKPPPFGPFAILNGLNEPPPHAALFPPIEPALPPMLTRPTNELEFAGSEKQTEKQADKRELRLEEILDPNSLDRPVDQRRLDRIQTSDRDQHAGPHPVQQDNQGSSETPGGTNEPVSPKTRGRSRKNLRKWTEQETTDLLKGVVKCGIGNWTAILQQPELNFNKRSAANLKDRFRVCCPWAYGAADPNEATKQIQDTLANALMKAESLTSGAGGKILLPDPRPKDSTTSTEMIDPSPSKLSEPLSLTKPTPTPTTSGSPPYSTTSTKTAPTQSLKSKSTLSSLGVAEPYFTIKSKRRSRRPFTPAEDEALLKGYAVHGFQWTLIQQDRHLNLSHRRATDLRDRFRTKFPNAYREGGSVSGGSIGSLRREHSSENNNSSTPSSDSRGNIVSGLKESQPHSTSILPPPVISSTATLADQKGRPPREPSSISSLQLGPSLDSATTGGGSSLSSFAPSTRMSSSFNG